MLGFFWGEGLFSYSRTYKKTVRCLPKSSKANLVMSNEFPTLYEKSVCFNGMLQQQKLSMVTRKSEADKRRITLIIKTLLIFLYYRDYRPQAAKENGYTFGLSNFSLI